MGDTTLRIRALALGLAHTATSPQDALESLERLIGVLEVLTNENIEPEKAETARLLTILKTYINDHELN